MDLQLKGKSALVAASTAGIGFGNADHPACLAAPCGTGRLRGQVIFARVNDHCMSDDGVGTAQFHMGVRAFVMGATGFIRHQIAQVAHVPPGAVRAGMGIAFRIIVPPAEVPSDALQSPYSLM